MTDFTKVPFTLQPPNYFVDLDFIWIGDNLITCTGDVDFSISLFFFLNLQVASSK